MLLRANLVHQMTKGNACHLRDGLTDSSERRHAIGTTVYAVESNYGEILWHAKIELGRRPKNPKGLLVTGSEYRVGRVVAGQHSHSRRISVPQVKVVEAEWIIVSIEAIVK